MHAPFHPAFRVEWRALTALESITGEWRSLAARAIEPNVFYEPAFALAAAPVFGEGAGVTLVWSTTGRPMGFFPTRIKRWRAGLCSAATGWTHPYAPLGIPLVDRDQAEVVLGAWLDHLATDPAMPALLLMPLVTEGGPFAAALDSALANSGRRSTPLSRHQARCSPPEPSATAISTAPCRRARARNCAGNAAGSKRSHRSPSRPPPAPRTSAQR